MRALTLHVFASVKGGVGKSTLAITCARLLAQANRPPLVLDCDFTGTSLADGLPLRAPAVDGRTGVRLDLGEAPAGSLLSLDETRARRNRRRDERKEGVGRYLPYVNDLLSLFDPSSACYPVEWFLWRHEPDDGVLYMPSSPHRYDVRVARTWLLHESPGAFIQHIAWLLDHLIRTHPELRDIVIDLPPGTIGFAHDILSLAAALDSGSPLPEGYPNWGEAGVRWETRAWLVTSEDRNDLSAAVDYLAEQVAVLRSLRAIVNRRVESRESIADTIRRQFMKGVAEGLGIESRVDLVDEDRDTLGTLFRMKGLHELDPALRTQLGKVFEREVSS